MESCPFLVYILRCSDKSYYVGQTDDLKARLAIHNSRQGPKYTATRTPVELVYYESFLSRAEAMDREKQLKRWSRAKKEALIAGDVSKLRRLSKKK